MRKNMVGFLIGTVALVGLVKAARGGRCGGYGRFGHGAWGHHPGRSWGHHGGHWGRGGFSEGGPRGGRFGRAMLRGVFERLETSPGQEKVIMEAVDAVREAAGKLTGEAGQSRSDFARAMRGEHFDTAQVNETFTRHDESLKALRETVAAQLSRVHEALDDRQRRDLADLIDQLGGGRGFGRGFGGPGSGPFGARYV